MSVKYGECHPKLWQIKKMPKRHQKEYFSILFVLGFTVETICNAIEAAPAQIKHLFRELDFRPEALSDHHKRYVQSVLDKIRDMSENHRLVISFEHIYDALEMVNFRDSHSFYQIMMATAKEEVGRLERRKAKRNQAEKAQNASTEATVQPIECGEDSRMITMEDIVGSIRNLTDDEILKLAENCPLYAIDWAQFMAKPDTAEGDRSNRDNTKKGYLENVMLFWRPTTGMIAKYLFCDMVTSGAIRHYVEKFYLQYEPINVRSNEYKGVNEAFKLWAELKRWHTFTGTPQAETLGETEVSTVQPVDETEATEGEVETEAPSVVPTINDIVHKTDDELETEGLTDEEAQTSVEKCPVQPVGVEEFRSWPFEKRFDYMLTLRNYWGISFVAICQILFKDEISPSKYYGYVAEHRIPSKPGRYTASRAVVLAFGIWCEIVAGDGTRPNDVTNSSQPEEPSNSSGENDEVANEPSTPPQSDSETNCSEEEAEESSAPEIPPVADSEATLLPNGEIVLNQDLEPAKNDDSTGPEPETNSTKEPVEFVPPMDVAKTMFGEIDGFYSLKIKIPFEGYCELEEVVRKYRRAGAAKVLQSSYSDLDVMSLEA